MLASSWQHLQAPPWLCLVARSPKKLREGRAHQGMPLPAPDRPLWGGKTSLLGCPTMRDAPIPTKRLEKKPLWVCFPTPSEKPR